MGDPSAVYCMEKYGNWERVRDRRGEFGVVRLPDGKLYEAWYIYYKETDPEFFDNWIKNTNANMFGIPLV